ncbi:MAG: hypothetical protein K0Q73_6547 [Paenibacillus sp.]|jgi:hypothetical protein|nr:hypothetical protein [Paenibacillus sp.]
MAKKFKNNKSNKYSHNNEFAEEVLAKHDVTHPAQNNPGGNASRHIRG